MAVGRRNDSRRIGAVSHHLAGRPTMLTRVLEPEAMDTADEAADYDSMDHSEVNRRFVADFLAALVDADFAGRTTACRVLDLGTGTAQIPIELVRQARTQSIADRLEI